MNDSITITPEGQVIQDENISKKFIILANEKPERKSLTDTGYEWDERGMAELFALTYNEECRYCAEAKCWYTYTDGVWKKDDSALYTMGKLIEFTRLMDLYVPTITDTDLRHKYKKFVIKLGDRRFRDRIIKDAANNEILLISASQFDANPYLVNCKNGTYNLQTHTWTEHNPKDLLTMQTRFSYRPWDKIRCERWEKFIDDIMSGDKEKAKYLQKAIGYSILGKQNEECMFLLYGKTTRNGKSTLLNTLCYMLGGYADVSPVSIICKSQMGKNSEGATPMIASLKGKRLVTMAESNQYGKLDEECIKQLTGGEEIKARNLYEKPVTFLPQFTMWLSCNDLPMVQDKSVFASERLLVITFDRHFNQSEQDKNLKSFFCTSDSMRGIFEWIIDGYKLYIREGLNKPSSVQNAINQYARDNDLVLQFLEDTCEKAPDRGIKSKVLYESYKDWCKQNGSYVCTSRKFYAEMSAHCEWYSSTVVRNGYPYYCGLDFKGGD